MGLWQLFWWRYPSAISLNNHFSILVSHLLSYKGSFHLLKGALMRRCVGFGWGCGISHLLFQCRCPDDFTNGLIIFPRLACALIMESYFVLLAGKCLLAEQDFLWLAVEGLPDVSLTLQWCISSGRALWQPGQGRRVYRVCSIAFKRWHWGQPIFWNRRMPQVLVQAVIRSDVWLALLVIYFNYNLFKHALASIANTLFFERFF